jgi:hypothetical protein
MYFLKCKVTLKSPLRQGCRNGIEGVNDEIPEGESGPRARRSSLDIPGYKASNLKTRCLKTLRVDPLQLSKIGKII